MLKQIAARLRPLLPAIALALALAPATALAKGRSIYYSPDLWATIDACNPPDQLDTIGIRASMPGTGIKGELMYMRFRMQYQDATGVWRDAAFAASGFQLIGPSGRQPLQSGRSFQFRAAAGQHYLYRGAVTFEWRHGRRVVRSIRKHTVAGHPTSVGADPRGYSAAACQI